MAIDLKKLQERLYDVSPSHTPSSIDLSDLRSRLNPYQQQASEPLPVWTPAQETARLPAVQAGRYLAQTTMPEPKESSFWKGTKAVGLSAVTGTINYIRQQFGSLEDLFKPMYDVAPITRSVPFAQRIGIFGQAAKLGEEQKEELKQDASKAKQYFDFYKDLSPKQAIETRAKISSVLNAREKTVISKKMKDLEDYLRNEADVASLGAIGRTFAMGAESLPAMLGTRFLPYGLGFTLMGNNVFRNTLDQARMEYQARGEVPDEEAIYIRATADAALEIAVESMFGAFGKVGGLIGKTSSARNIMNATDGWLARVLRKVTGGTATAKQPLPTMKNWIKAVRSTAIEEGFEEAINEIGSAFIAKWTTNPDDPVFTWKEKQGGLTTPAQIGQSAAVGALMGFMIPAVTSSYTFPKTKAKLKEIANKPVNNLTHEDIATLYQFVQNDMTRAEAQEYILTNLTKGILKSPKSNPVEVAKSIDQAYRQSTDQPEATVAQPSDVEAQEETVGDVLNNILQREQQTEAVTTPSAQETVTAPAAPSEAPEVSTPSLEVETPSTPAVEPQTSVQEASAVQPIKEVAEVAPKTTKVKQPKEFYSMLRGKDGKPAPTRIENARAIKVESMPDRQFFAYKTDGAKPTWSIVDSEIGLSIVTGMQTRKAALARANEIINERGIDWYNERVAEAKEKIGVMPPFMETGQPEASVPVAEQQEEATQPAKPKEPEQVKTIRKVKEVPTRKLQDIYRKLADGEDVTADMTTWIDSEEATPLREKYSTNGEIDSAKLGSAIMTLSEQMLEQAANGEDILKVDLQMLALKSLADRLKAGKPGEALSRYMKTITELVQKHQTDDVIDAIDSELKNGQLFHKILGNETSNRRSERQIDKGGATYLEGLVDKALTNEMLTADEVISLSKYVSALVDAQEFVRANEVAAIVSNKMTRMGQAIQAVAFVKKVLPSYMADSLIKQIQSGLDVSSVQKERVKTLAGKTVENAKQTRQKAIDDVALNIDSDIPVEDRSARQGKPPKKPAKKQKPKTAQELLAQRIKSDLNKGQKLPPTEVDKIVQRLFAKFRDVAPKTMSEQAKADPYLVIYEMAKNREKYKQIWQEARDIVYTMEGITDEQAKSITDYFLTFGDPVMADKYIRQLVTENLRRSGMSMKQVAQRYSASGGTSINFFMDTLRMNMNESLSQPIDDVTFDYIKRYVKNEFVKRMEHYRESMHNSILSQAEKAKARQGKKAMQSHQQEAIDKLIDAVFYDTLNVSEMETQWAKFLGVAHVTTEMMIIINRASRKIASAKDAQTQSDIYDQMIRELSTKIPVSATEKFAAIARTAMLLNPVTWARNALSNISTGMYYRFSDRLTNRIMKNLGVPEAERIAGDTFIDIDANSDIGNVVLSETTDAQIKREMAKTAKYTFKQLLNREVRMFGDSVVQKIVDVPISVLNEGKLTLGNKEISIRVLGDVYMYQKHYRNHMANRLNAMGYKDSLSASQKQRMIAKAKAEAAEIATIRTFRQINIISAVLTGMRKISALEARIKEMEKQGRNAEADRIRTQLKAFNAASRIITPFVITPAALIAEGYKFSPVALAVSLGRYFHAKGVIKKTGSLPEGKSAQAISRDLGQAMLGTMGQFLIGLALSMLGFLTGAPPDNEKEREAWKLAGKRAYSLYIPGVGSFSIDWLQPISTGVIMGAQTGEVLSSLLIDKDEKTIEEVTSEFSAAVIDSLFTNSIVENFQRTFGGYKSGASDVARDILVDGVGQTFPTMLARMNRIFDPYQRDIYTGNAATVLAKRFIAVVPFGSFLLPPKYDIWGEPVRQVKAKGVIGITERAMLNMLAPFIVSEAYRDDVTKEIVRLHKATQYTMNNDALPSLLGETITINYNGKSYKYTMDNKEYEWYTNYYGQMAKDRIQKLMDSKDYATYSDETKVRRIRNIYSTSRERAVREFISEFVNKKALSEENLD